VERFYGERVRVEYHDVGSPAEAERHQKLLAQVPNGYLYFPLLFVNGELKNVGSAKYYEIIYAIREALEPAPQN